MQLDISCVRSILLTVEKYETIYESVSFDGNIYTYYDDYLSSYDFPKILYHVQYCIKAGLLSDVCSNKIWGRTQFDCCLEPFGHDFLANTRTEEKWSRTQALSLQFSVFFCMSLHRSSIVFSTSFIHSPLFLYLQNQI